MSAPRVLFRKIRSARARLRQLVVSQRFGFDPSAIYDDAFYDGPGCAQGREHAAAVAGILIERFAPTTFFDFGCGTAGVLAAAAARGVAAYGCEGSSHAVRRCSKDVLVFQADLKRPVQMNRTFDLVTCVEVAEHLPKKSAPVLVASMANAATRSILFSASGPGQWGEDHINLQPPDYWAKLFSAHGFRWLTDDSLSIREAFAKAGAPKWFQNSIVLVRH